VLGPVHVDGRVREVAQAAGVVPVHVRQHHVRHVRRRVAEPLDLADRGLFGVESRPGGERLEGVAARLAQCVAQAAQALDVGEPDAAVHEREPVAGLHQQAVADHPRREERKAVAVDGAAA
jgi:hypothetical protein